jgi:hypothetical protein
VAARQAAARHVGGALAPQRQHVEAAPHRAVLAPQHAQRLRELAAGGNVGAVVHQVDGGGGAVVGSQMDSAVPGMPAQRSYSASTSGAKGARPAWRPPITLRT